MVRLSTISAGQPALVIEEVGVVPGTGWLRHVGSAPPADLEQLGRAGTGRAAPTLTLKSLAERFGHRLGDIFAREACELFGEPARLRAL